jgi:hypothetical protein
MSAINGYGITTDDQLRNLAKRMGFTLNYVGFAENLPKHAPIGYNIINLGGPETQNQGTHWVLWYVDPSLDFSVYFDSYGAPPEDRVLQLSPLPMIVNGKQLQRYNEEYCGIWAITAAAFIHRSSNKKSALSEFVDKYEAV